MKTALVLLLLGVLAINSAYGLKCVTCDNCDDDIPEAKDCKEDGNVKPTVQPGYPTVKPEDPKTTLKPDDPKTTPKPDDPKTTPKPDDPKTTPKPDDPKTTPKPDEPEKTPKPDEPEKTPKPDEPVKTPKPEPEGSGEVVEKSSRSIRSANKYLRAEEEYKCFKYDIKWGSGTITKRGCTAKKTECKDIEDNVGKEYMSNCNFCDSDNCNPASNIKSWAFSSVILVAIVKMFL